MFLLQNLYFPFIENRKRKNKLFIFKYDLYIWMFYPTILRIHRKQHREQQRHAKTYNNLYKQFEFTNGTLHKL